MSIVEQVQSNGSLIGRIQADRPKLSKAFGLVADVLIEGPAQFMAWSVQEISAAAGVSEPSVVRFCRHYGFNGVPEFRIALAMSLVSENSVAHRPFLEPTIADKAFVNRNMKIAVAREAAGLLEADRSIILDSGSTLQYFAQHLRSLSGRTILTTGLNILETLWGCRQHTIILPGGTVRFDARALTGRMVEQALGNMRFDTVYFGADSVDPDEGLSTFNEEEAHQNAAMANVSRRIVVLVDSTKFRAPSLHRFCSIDRIDTIVTDWNISKDVEDAFRKRGVNLIIANQPTEDE
jgi:DeoR family galactitol utilization operon repressor